jgi:hypothetical protein
MIKYIDIKVILNFIPQSIRDEAGDTRLLSWAFQALRQYLPKKAFHGLALKVKPLINHKVDLEPGTRRIEGAWYLDDLEKFQSLTAAKFVTDNDGLKDNSNRVEFLSERTIAYEEIQKYGEPMKYVGEHGFLVNNDYLRFYDGNCHIGFSVDYGMNCMEVDTKTGYVILLYQEFKKDADGFMIPDEAGFIQALAYAAEAQAWRERSAMKEQGAEQMYQTREREAKTYFISANGRQALRLYKAGYHVDAQRKAIQYDSEISGNYKNRRYS